MYKKYNKNNLIEHLSPSSFVSCPNMPGIIIKINIYVSTLLPDIDLSKEDKNSIIRKLINNTYFPSTGTLNSIGYNIVDLLCLIYDFKPSRICDITIIPKFEDIINNNSTIQLSFIITDRKNGDRSYSSSINLSILKSISDNSTFKCIGDWIIQDFIDSRIAINKLKILQFKKGTIPDVCNPDKFTSNIIKNIKQIKSDASISYIPNCSIYQSNKIIENFNQNIPKNTIEYIDASKEVIDSAKETEKILNAPSIYQPYINNSNLNYLWLLLLPIIIFLIYYMRKSNYDNFYSRFSIGE